MGASKNGAALTAEGIQRLHEVAQRSVDGGQVPGLVALVARGEQVHTDALGTMAVSGPPVARDSIFRISCDTKPITAAVTLALAAEGLLDIDEPVDRLLPELAGRRVLRRMDGPPDETVPAHRPVTARDLLAFSRMLLRGGAPVLPAESVRAMTTGQLTPEQEARGGLGPDFFKGRSWGFGQAVLDSGAYGWAGGFGSTWLMDPNQDLTVLVLTQRMFGSGEPPALHTDYQAAAYAALG